MRKPSLLPLVLLITVITLAHAQTGKDVICGGPSGPAWTFAPSQPAPELFTLHIDGVTLEACYARLLLEPVPGETFSRQSCGNGPMPEAERCVTYDEEKLSLGDQIDFYARIFLGVFGGEYEVAPFVLSTSEAPFFDPSGFAFTYLNGSEGFLIVITPYSQRLAQTTGALIVAYPYGL